MNYIVDGLTEVVIAYTSLDTGDFNQQAFFNNTYKHNVDIWGLLSVYFCHIVDMITGKNRYHFNTLTKKENYTLLMSIKLMTSKYIFNPEQQLIPIDVNKVKQDLKNLNNIFPNIAQMFNHSSSPVVINIPSTSSKVSSVHTPLKSTRVGVPVLKSKKTRKKHVVCDDAKKSLCRSKGKICNETTGRCKNP